MIRCSFEKSNVPFNANRKRWGNDGLRPLLDGAGKGQCNFVAGNRGHLYNDDFKDHQVPLWADAMKLFCLGILLVASIVTLAGCGP